jgi:putative FmdB family regulatory protein
MPTYEFACPNGHHFDKFYRKMSDAVGELPCSICGEIAVRQISGGAGLVFKGSGFYITDYGKDGKKGMTPSPSSSTTDGGGSNAPDKGGAAKSDGASPSSSPGEAKPAPAAKSTKDK